MYENGDYHDDLELLDDYPVKPTMEEKVDYVYNFCKTLEAVINGVQETPMGNSMLKMAGIDLSAVTNNGPTER